MANFDPHISKTVQPFWWNLKFWRLRFSLRVDRLRLINWHIIIIIYNYLPKTTRHARPHVAVSTSVVCANTQFATVSFFPCLFSFFWFLQLAPRSHQWTDLHQNWHVSACGFGQGRAFWGSRWWPITFRGSDPKKNKIWGAWIGISSQIYKKIQIVISSKLCIGLA